MNKYDVIFITTLDKVETAFMRRMSEKFKKVLFGTDFKKKVFEIRRLYKIPANGLSLDNDKVQAVNDMETCNRINSITNCGEEMEIMDSLVELYINYFTDFREKAKTKKYFTNTEIYFNRAYLPKIDQHEQEQWAVILKFYLFFNDVPSSLLPAVGDLRISMNTEVTKQEIKEYIDKLPDKRVRATTTLERNLVILKTHKKVRELKRLKKLEIIEGNSMVNYVMDYLPENLKGKVNFETVRKVIYSGKIN